MQDEPKKGDANGLINCLGTALKELGIKDVLDKASVLDAAAEKPVLVSGGTDGASVCIGEHNGMKGKLQSAIPWLFWAWCYAHRLELACKSALSSPLVTNITEMLLRLYYLYSKSPMKLRELTDIATDLKEVFDFPDGGDRPVRSQGSRWIAHKRNAMQRVVQRYGAYIAHLTTLAADKTVTSAERARLQGYLRKWQQGRMLIGIALYTDVLKPPSLLSKSLQADDLDIVQGLKLILKSKQSLQSLSEQDPQEWPMVKLVLSRLSDDNTYQGATLLNYNDTVLQSCKSQALADLKELDKTMRQRLEWTDTKILRSILIFLDTQSWCSSVTDDDETDQEDKVLAQILSAVEYITVSFREPLEAKGVDLACLQDEVEEVVEHARQYLSLDKEDYRRIWYKLSVSPDASRWKNVLMVSELGFSLPFSNGCVERLFSSLKLVKTDRRTRMHKSTLGDLMEIQAQGLALGNFSPEQAVSLWWTDCNTTRRVNQEPRREYRTRKTTEADSSPEPEKQNLLSLEEWDKWFDDSED